MHGRVGMVLGITLLLIGCVALAGWRLYVLQQTAQEARDHLGAARAVLSQATTNTAAGVLAPGADRNQLLSACNEATAASDALHDVQSQLQSVMPLVGALESLPVVGTKARSQTATLQAGSQLAAVGASVCDGLGPLSTLLLGGSPTAGADTATDLLRALAGARPKLLAASQRLQELQRSLGEISEQDIDAANRPAFVALRQRLPQVVTTLRDATILLDLLGAEHPRRYLVVSQNPDELRATGGFIGSAGVLAAEGGSVRLIEYGTSRRYDTPAALWAVPPPAFQAYLGANQWSLAAANWWASFPDVARQLTYFYGLTQPGQPVDGVIALDQFGLERVLEVLGPVDVPEYGERVSASEVEAKLDHYVHAGDWRDESGRKQFTAALSTAVLRAVLGAPRSALPDLITAVRAALDEQHLLVWVPEPEAAQLFASKRWDGGLLPTSGDALMLLDTDVVASKQSQSVRRDATYRVNVTGPAAATASLTVAYTNQARPEQRPEIPFVPVYRTFLRVLVPPGATLVSSSGFDAAPMVDEECGRRVFAGQVSIPEGARVQVSLEYQLPASVLSAGYDLLVQQQPGVPPGQMSVAVTTRGSSVARTELSNAPGRHARWQLDASGSPVLQPAPLPEAKAGGCGQPIVPARPMAPPERIEVPAVGIDARVVDLGVSDQGEMEAPSSPDVVGWYRMSSRPGQPGNSVMSGHVDWAHNTAVFWALRKLKPGDQIQVRGTDGVSHTYAVEWNESFPSTTAPVDDIVGPAKDSVLTLITCDGVYDPHLKQYLERRVVRAHLVS